jgi:hypothetical protein
MLARKFMVGVVGVGKARGGGIPRDAVNTLGDDVEVGIIGVVLVDIGNCRELCNGEEVAGSASFEVK